MEAGSCQCGQWQAENTNKDIFKHQQRTQFVGASYWRHLKLSINFDLGGLNNQQCHQFAESIQRPLLTLSTAASTGRYWSTLETREATLSQNHVRRWSPYRPKGTTHDQLKKCAVSVTYQVGTDNSHVLQVICGQPSSQFKVLCDGRMKCCRHQLQPWSQGNGQSTKTT